MTTLPNNTALIIIDVQKGFDNPAWGERTTPDAEANIERLLQHWRETVRPVFIVQHLSLEPGSALAPDAPGCELKDIVKPQPGEPLIQKNVNSAFIGTDLEKQLRERGVDTLVLVGLTTNHCVSTTARMAENLGFDTYVVADATAAFAGADHNGNPLPAELIHTVSLANLHGEFAEVVTTEQIMISLQ